MTHADIAATKRRIERERVALMAEMWAFLRTCQDGLEWETISHLLFQLRDMPRNAKGDS